MWFKKFLITGVSLPCDILHLLLAACGCSAAFLLWVICVCFSFLLETQFSFWHHIKISKKKWQSILSFVRKYLWTDYLAPRDVQARGLFKQVKGQNKNILCAGRKIQLILGDRLQKFTCSLKECLHGNRSWINPATCCKDPTSISRMYLQKKLNQRIKIINDDSLMAFPALSAILSVHYYTQTCCTAGWEPERTCLTLQEHHPSSH